MTSDVLLPDHVGRSQTRSVLILADEESAQVSACHAAGAAGLSATKVVPLALGLEALGDFAVPDVTVVHVVTITPQTDSLLDRIDQLALSGETAGIVAFSAPCIDAVAARISSPQVALLCDPGRAELAIALGLAAACGRDGVRQARTDDEADRLQKIADEVARIAETLSNLAGGALGPGGDAFSDGMIGYRAEPAATLAEARPLSAAEVRGMIRIRRLRDRFLPEDLFADPAWDMLLDLIAARIERSRVAVSSLCIAAAVPPTTALRMIRTMTDRGLFVRIADPNDKRRVYIDLAESTAAAMTAYLSTAKAQAGLLV